jgi:ABC-type Mn2+/Zn2+ transport system permease subunit
VFGRSPLFNTITTTSTDGSTLLTPLATSPLLEPFTGELTRLAGLELVILGAACGALGAWVVQLGRAFLSESLTHALLPGLVIGYAGGLGLAAGALLGTIAAFGANAAAARAPRTSPSSATAIAVTTLVGAGAVLAVNFENAGLLERLLFGDPLGIDTYDILAGAVLAAGVAAALWLLRRPLAAYAFERESVATLGINASAVEWAFLGVLSLTVATAAFIAGSLLAPALMTGPALGLRAARAHAAHLPLYAGILGGVCGLAGVYLSYVADLPVSASVALCCALSALLPALLDSVGPTSRRRRRSSRY